MLSNVNPSPFTEDPTTYAPPPLYEAQRVGSVYDQIAPYTYPPVVGQVEPGL